MLLFFLFKFARSNCEVANNNLIKFMFTGVVTIETRHVLNMFFDLYDNKKLMLNVLLKIQNVTSIFVY